MALFQLHNHTVITKIKQGRQPSVPQQVGLTPTVPDGDSIFLKTFPNVNNSMISQFFCLFPKQVSWLLSGRLEVQFFQDRPLKSATTNNPCWEQCQANSSFSFQTQLKYLVLKWCFHAESSFLCKSNYLV